MRSFLGKRYWLVGASEGIGRSLALAMSREGAEVIVSARSQARLDDLVAEMPGPARAEVVDVQDRASVEAVAEGIGPLHGMVYLAGLYWPMAAQDWDPAQAELTADVNYTGAVRCVGAVLPAMQAQGSGHVVLTGSLSGFRGLPKAGAYGSSKAAVMSLAESLYADCQGSEIAVQLVNPGFVKTRLTDKNSFTMPFITTPEAAAEQMLTHMRGYTFKRNFPSGFAALFRISQFLPDWAYYPLFR